MSPRLGNCWNCGEALNEVDYGRQDTCSQCRKDTHVCRNCGFYDPAYNNQCREPQSDRVVEKERANFCDYFSATTTSGKRGSTADELRSAAEALFKKK